MLVKKHGLISALRALTAFSFVLLIAASHSSGATFSFASDENHDGPTFQDLDVTVAPDVGQGTSPPDVSGKVEVDFKIDVNGDTPGGLTIIPATFDFEGVFTSQGTTPVGGETLHWWRMDGSYSFTDLSASLLKKVDFQGAIFTALAPDASAISDSATIQANSASSTLSPTLGQGLIDRGFTAGDGEFAMTDFAFTLTNIRTYPGGAKGVPVINPEGSSIIHLGEAWISEGSYSATSTYLTPEPGTLMLLGWAFLAGLIGTRRRHR